MKREFRFAKSEDTAIILNFIKELAEYEKMSNLVVADEKTLKTWLFEKLAIKSLTTSGGDLKTLLPLILKSFTPPQQEKPAVSPRGLDPIKDVASAEIISTLGNYFEN